jgi:hypothetical protein
MRKASLLGVTLALAALLAGRADAAVLPLNGTLSIDLGGIAVVTLTGSGTGTSNGPFGLATVPHGLVSLATTATFPIQPPALNLSKITVMGPASSFAGSFDPGGNMGNDAVANLFFTDGAAAGAVPLRYVGVATGCHLFVCPPFTIVGVAWTNLGATAADPTKTTMLMQTAAGIPVTVTATAFDARTAGGAGTVQLVAPTLMKIFGGSLGSLPIVGTLTLRFVPEPGALLLLGSGVAGLAAAGRRSARGRARACARS